ncbi:hypothetical protein ABW21_db0203515 [Orbilia brochopaga]|nr:hypothetical protein ABW21_db0203515 [Drechslerella brochopaga]
MSSTLWNRRTTPGKLTLSVSNPDGNSNPSEHPTPSSARGFGSGKGRGAASRDGSGRFDPLSAVPLSAGGSFKSNTLASPSTAFSLGSGAFASFGAMKTPTKSTGDPIASAAAPKEPQGPAPSSGAVTPAITGPTFASAAAAANQKKAPPEVTKSPLRYTWVVWYRAPGNRNQDYEKSTQPIAQFSTVEEFWTVYAHLRKPGNLPHVSDYHIFKQGIRPVWEDSENRKGGKWIIRLKKGISNRYWEDLVLAIVGDQFGESGEDICGAVLSIRNAEDVLSIWTRVQNATTLKIRETIKRVLGCPPETVIIFKTHDESIAQERNVQGQIPSQGQSHRQTNQYNKQDRQAKNTHHQSNNQQQSYSTERRE